MNDGAEARDGGAFFGRRKGKKLRDLQEERLRTLLPALRVDLAQAGVDPAALFEAPPAELHLEIGFGGGEHLARVARERPEIGIIGCEPFVNGVVKLLAAVDEGGLRNVRVFDEDATRLVEALPDACLARVYILYPDPWPKRRQRKRRLVSDELLSGLARVMRPGAELRFATDIDDYAGWVLARMLRRRDFAWAARTAADWTRPWSGWESTRYEAKARREGRGSAYLTFTRAG